MDYPVASAAMSSTAARTRLSLFDKVSSVFICLLFLLFLSLVHSNQDIDEDSPNGRIDQSDEGGEHGGVVEEVNNIHNYGFLISGCEDNNNKYKKVSLFAQRCLYSTNLLSLFDE